MDVCHSAGREAVASHDPYGELYRAPEPRVRKAHLKNDLNAVTQRRPRDDEHPTTAPSTRPVKPPKPLKRKTRPAVRNTDVCGVLPMVRDCSDKRPTFNTDANPSPVAIQPWYSGSDALPHGIRSVKERARVTDEDLCGPPRQYGVPGRPQQRTLYAFSFEGNATTPASACSDSTAMADIKPRKTRPPRLPVRSVALADRSSDPPTISAKRRGTSMSRSIPKIEHCTKERTKKDIPARTSARRTKNEISMTDPDCGVSLPHIAPAPGKGTANALPAKPQSFNKRRPRSRSRSRQVTTDVLPSSRLRTKDRGHCSIFTSKTAEPSWSTTAEASNSLDRDLENLAYDMDADEGSENITTLEPRESPMKDAHVSAVSDNSLLETTTSGDLTRSSSPHQLKKELLVFHVIILVAVSGAAALAITFYPGAVKGSLGFPAVVQHQPPSFVSSAPPAWPSQQPMNAPEEGAPRGEQLYDVCSSEQCQRDGAYINALISKDFDPCDNFYKFVCDRWKGLNGTTSPDDELSLKLESDIYHILLSPLAASVQDSEILSPLKRVMTACMNAVNGTSVDPILDLLAAADLEGFPFTPPVRGSISAWKTAARVFLLTGTSALLRIGVALHPFEPERDIITVEVPDRLIVGPRKTIRAYRRLMQASMNALGKRFVPSSYVMEVVKFTQQLDAAVDAGESQYRQERLHQVAKLRHESELHTYVLEILGDLQLPPDDDEHDVMLLSPDFFRALKDLLRKTDVHVVLNFLCVHVLVRSSVFVSMADPDLEWAVSAQLFKRPVQRMQRWRLCVRAASQALPNLFLYATHQVVRAPASTLHSILDNVLKQVITHIESLIFLDGQTRVLAKRVLSDVRFIIGLPPWLRDMSKVSAYVAKFPLFNNQGHFLRWLSEVSEMVQTSTLRRSSKEVWRGSPFETDCWYDLQLKTVYIPALLANWTLYRIDKLGNLQLPRQGHRAARCLLRMLFEGVSSFFNREILTRSFWSSSAKTSLRRAQLCLQEQASVPPPLSLTLLEDHTALRIIQDVYVANVQAGSGDLLSGRLRNVRLPGAEDFTADHLFFIYYALSFCASGFREAELEDEARLVNIPLRGSLMFQEVYGCRPTSKMGPLDKCTAWVVAAKQSASQES